MIGMGGLGLNLNSLNDSVASSMSVRDMYSNSNLNSASSLSWADDVSLVHGLITTEHRCFVSLPNDLTTNLLTFFHRK